MPLPSGATPDAPGTRASICAMLTELGHRPLIPAVVTPLRDDGSALDEAAIGPYVAFLESNGADGAFVCGTTGEGILLSLEERRRVARAFRAAVRGRARRARRRPDDRRYRRACR